MSRVIRFIFLFISLTVLSAPAVAAKRYFVPKLPPDFSKVEIFLLTTLPGGSIEDRFGHTGLRVVDDHHGTDVVYNWGTFSFEDPLFAWHFFRGELRYRFGVRRYSDHIRFAEQERRILWEDKLQLTNKQKKELLGKIATNAKPENREFLYQYWFNNCATIPRDLLDSALAGNLRERTEADILQHDFRSYVRSNLSYFPGIELALELIMNGNIDRPISAWESMFLPENLRSYLLSQKSVADNGQVSEANLVIVSRQLTSFPKFAAEAGRDYLGVGLWFGLTGLFSLVGVLIKRRSGAMPSFFTAFFGGSLATYGLFSGLFGTVMILNWMVSGHPDTWHNANLFLFWPLDFVFVGVGLALMRDKGPVKDRFVFAGGLRSLCVLHLIGLVSLHVGTLAGWVQQDTWWTRHIFGVAHLLFYSFLPLFLLRRYFAENPQNQKSRLSKGASTQAVPQQEL